MYLQCFFHEESSPTTAGHSRSRRFSFILTSDVCARVSDVYVSVLRVRCERLLHSLHRHATESVEDFSLHFEMPNADDDSVSGVCCSTAVPARGGDILTRSGVRLGIICTYIIYLFTYMLYIRTHILHIRYIRIYIYIK